MRWLPRRCRLCEVVFKGDCNICPRCVEQFADLPPLCGRCAETLPAADVDCVACLDQAPDFDQVLVAWVWAAPLNGLIRRFKFDGNRAIGWDLSQLLAKKLLPKIDKFAHRPDSLLPMPLHKSRLIERGFNQSYLLASALSKAWGLPLLSGVERMRATPPQSGLSRRQRQKNLRGAFAVQQASKGGIKGKHIVLVDDVMTTGSSAQELSRTLLREGAASVAVVVVCKVLK